MTKREPILDYASPPQVVDQRWGWRIAAGFAGFFSLGVAAVLLVEIGRLPVTLAELLTNDQGLWLFAGYTFGCVLLAMIAIIPGLIGRRLLGFAWRSPVAPKREHAASSQSTPSERQ